MRSAGICTYYRHSIVLYLPTWYCTYLTTWYPRLVCTPDVARTTDLMRYEPTDGRGPSFSIGVWSLRCLRRLGLKKTLNEALETFKLVNTRNVTTHFLFRAHYPKSYISPCYSLISFLSQLTSTATPFFNPQKEAEQAKSNLEASVVLPLYYHLCR